MFVTFITRIIRWYFYQIMDYRDTCAYILDPCIQEFLKLIPVLKFTQYNLFHFMIWLDLGAEIETTTCIEKIYDDKLDKFESKWVIIDLFDVTQKCHTSHGPMPGTNVTFKVNWTNVVQICSSWFSINWALIQFWVFTSCCVYGIDINYRHLFIQNFWPWFH